MDTASLIAEIKSRPAHDVRCERILVAIDGSHASFHAATWAIELGRRTAFEQVSTSGYLPAELKISAYRLLAELMHEIPHNVRAHPRVAEGNPGETIVAVAAEEESDLIVMGTRGFGTFERLAFGSVSSYVSKHSHCPVFLSK